VPEHLHKLGNLTPLVLASVLYPLTGGLLNPMIASAAKSLSSVTVIGNALRLRRTTI